MEDQVRWEYFHHGRQNLQIVALMLHGYIARKMGFLD